MLQIKPAPSRNNYNECRKSMKAFYWECANGNFGDDLNLWLWDFLLPGFREVDDDLLLVGVGTVLNGALLPPTGRKLVIGSGFGYGSLPDMSDRAQWDIRCVRGPLTAEKLMLPTDMGIVDPAVMVPDMPEFGKLPKLYKKSFVPHWESAVSGIWKTISSQVGLTYIDPCSEAKAVIRMIAQSELIVAESMHGAILADAFRVPWIPVSTSRAINSFKWNDWASTLGLTYRPRRVAISTRAEATMKDDFFWGMRFSDNKSVLDNPNSRVVETAVLEQARAPRKTSIKDIAKQALAVPSALGLWQASRMEPQLSSDTVLQERKSRFMDVISGVQRDYI